MNAPFVLAQATNHQTAATPPRVVKLSKPHGEQAIVVTLDSNTRLDLTGIVGEKITLVRVGERLVILFDNKATVAVSPFFDANGRPLPFVDIDLDGSRIVSADQFATLFPITDDQSILPAAGEGNPQNTTGPFGSTNVDALSTPDPLDLLGNEELGGALALIEVAPLVDTPLVPLSVSGALGTFTVQERALDLIKNPPSSPADLAEGRVTGTDPNSREETADNILQGVITGVTFTAGSGAINRIAFADPNVAGNVIAVKNEAGQDIAVYWVLSSDGSRLEGYLDQSMSSSSLAIVLQVSASQYLGDPANVPAIWAGPGQAVMPVVTVTLTQNFPHSDTDAADGDGIDGLDDLVTLAGFKLIASDTNGFVIVSPQFSIGVGDDAPVFESAGNSAFALVHDESPFAQGDADDISGFIPNLQAFALFLPVQDKGFDPQTLGLPLGYAKSAGALITVSVDYGADGAAATNALVYSFVLGQGDGTPSGLMTTEGRQILLYQEGDFIVGRVEGGPFDGQAAFALHMDSSGTVTLAQWLSIYNTDIGSHDELDSLASGALLVRVSVTDGDGDTVTRDIDISEQVGFQDDGPQAFNVVARFGLVRAVLDDENQSHGILGGPGDNGFGTQVSGLLSFTTGVDGLKQISVSEIVGVQDGNGGSRALEALYIDSDGVGHAREVQVVWTQNGVGGTLTGTAFVNGTDDADGVFTVFTLVVGPLGGYIITMHAPLVHPFTDADGLNNGPQTAWEDNLRLIFDYTVMDGDGDTADATLTVDVDDDSPKFGTVENQSVTSVGTTVSGDIEFRFGADGAHAAGGLKITGWTNLSGITESVSQDGRTLTAIDDATGQTIYILTLNDNGGYDFDLVGLPLAQTALANVSVAGGFGPVTEKDFGPFKVIAPSGHAVNGSGAGLGIDNNEFEPGESLTVQFVNPMTVANIGIDAQAQGLTIAWAAFNSADPTNFEKGTATFASDGTLVIDILGNDASGDGDPDTTDISSFDTLVLTGVFDPTLSGNPNNQKVKITFIGGTQLTPQDLPALQFELTATDGDNDAAKAVFTVDVDINHAPETHTVFASGLEDAAFIPVTLVGSDGDVGDGVASFRIVTLPPASEGKLYSSNSVFDSSTEVQVGDTLTATGNALTLYFVPAPDFNGNVTFNYAAIDTHGVEDTTPGAAEIEVMSVNDAPVITGGVTSGSVKESGDLAGIDEAGPHGGLEPGFTPGGITNTALGGIVAFPSILPTMLSIIDLETGSRAVTMAVVWDHLDDLYVAGGPNQANINEAFVRLGVEYAAYLKAGGMPFIDVTAKFTPDGADAGSNPDRLQSLHDNLLGNLTSAALTQRFGGNPALLTELTNLISGVDADLLTRPYYSGNEGTSDAAVRAWDLAHGYVPAATGQLNATDVDAGETASLTWSGNAGGAYGVFTIDPATGKWTYRLDESLPATQALAEGQVATEVFTVTVTDIHGAVDTVDVTITITGSNDAPVVSVPAAPLATIEDQPIAITGFGVSDPDSAVLTVTLSATSTLTLSTLAGLSFSAGDGVADQTMTFTGSVAAINAALSGMLYTPTPDFSGQGSISYVVSDGFESRNGTLNISIAPGNDAPVITSFSNGAVTEDHSFSQLVANGGFQSWSYNGTYTIPNWSFSGGFYYPPGITGIAHSGGAALAAYTYNSSVPGTVTQTLATDLGAVYRLGFYVEQWTASAAASFSISWNGTVLTAVTGQTAGSYVYYQFDVIGGDGSSQLAFDFRSGTAASNSYWFLDDVTVNSATAGVETRTGTIGFTDADLGDVHTVSYVPAGSGYVGSFTPVITDSATGDGVGRVTWTYTVNDADIQFLAQGETRTQTYTVTIDDGHGGTVSQNIDIVLHGVNDAPVAVNDTIIVNGYTGTGPGTAASTPVFNEVENNNNRANANVIDRSLLKIASNANLTDDGDPSITVKGSITSGNSSSDYFAIQLKAGETLILDIDNTSDSLDTVVRLYRATGSAIASNDDSLTSLGGGGSTDSNGDRDSYLTYIVTEDGTYYIEVARFNGAFGSTTGNYDLQISIDNFKGLQGGPISVPVAALLANDSDVDVTDTLSVVSVSGTGVQLSPDGQSVIVQAGVSSFTYTMTDGIEQRTATVNVTQVGGQTSNGTGGADVLVGSGGDDVLNGLGGNDLIFGGLGNDTLSGGGGADTFWFGEHGAANVDTILDYNFAAGDKLDLSALLGDNGDASHLRLVGDGGHVRVQVDVDGSGVGGTWSDVAILSGYNSAGNQVLVQLENSTQQLTVA